MSSVCSAALLAVAIATIGMAPSTAPALRVCADPNNLPFSNRREQGFENRIAALVARDLRRPLTYVWLPQRRGFIRNTLNADLCDVIVGVPAALDAVRPTVPYYRSSYVFLSRRDRALRLKSFDDPRLRRLTIGIQVTGDDYDNPPAAQALAARHIVGNIRGYSVYGDYSRPDPPRAIVDAVASGAVDVAVVWGPLAGYFAGRATTPLDIVPVSPDGDSRVVRFAFDIAMGVRQADAARAIELNQVIERRRADIHRILREFGVPLVGGTR
jgi:quinoprotein dehydrogenase-associated probable ABC transporter substrate-binding protein